MADLSEEQKKSYWRYNITLTTILLIVWFVVTYLISGLWAASLNQFLLSRISPRLLHGRAGLFGDLRHRDRRVRLPDEQAGSQIRHPRGGLSHESRKNLRTLHRLFSRRHDFDRPRGEISRPVAAMDRLDIHGPVAGHLHRHRHHHAHVQPGSILCRRPRRAGRV